jgi:hypothetical protein
MEIIVAGRQSGKTERILKWMKNAPENVGRVMICESPNEAMRVYRSTFTKEGNPTHWESWQFVSARELLSPNIFGGILHGRKWKIELAIDNLDILIQRSFRWPVGLVTMTNDKTTEEID